ncbi:MAG: 30S ribosome-binding factor RbfA [Chloroflexota bacterium]|nr:30S ribosome-binding factor RbfA [Chloroflexota bacterium]
MVSKLRAQRIADRIREELSEMLLLEIADPRLANISITDVRVDTELAYANIYVSALEGSERAEEVLEGLEHAKGYLRSALSHRIKLRTFPRLRFYWDPTFERAERIDQLIASLKEESDDSSIQENGSNEKSTNLEDNRLDG